MIIPPVNVENTACKWWWNTIASTHSCHARRHATMMSGAAQTSRDPRAVLQLSQDCWCEVTALRPRQNQSAAISDSHTRDCNQCIDNRESKHVSWWFTKRTITSCFEKWWCCLSAKLVIGLSECTFCWVMGLRIAWLEVCWPSRTKVRRKRGKYRKMKERNTERRKDTRKERKKERRT